MCNGWLRPGVTFSNSYTLERYLGWTGVCVEPLARPFAALTQARTCVAVNACAFNATTTVTFKNISGMSEMLSGIVGTCTCGASRRHRIETSSRTWQRIITSLFL